MIVETMTDLELLDEVRKDYDEIIDYCLSLCQNSVYKKRMQWGRPKGGKFVIRTNDWKSSRGNLYNLVIKTSGWNDFKKGIFDTTTTTFFKRNKAQNAIRLMFNEKGDIGIEIFTSHFIDRYNQRFLHQPFLSRKEALQLYMDKNGTSIIKSLDSSKYEYNVMVATNEGYSFGKFENDILLHKTFVSRDMLFGNQFDEADFLDEAVVNSQDGLQSNIFTIHEELSEVLSREKVIPTIDELDQLFELAEKQKEKLEALEHAGKEFDMEYLEMQNQFLLLAAGYDWSKGQVKDDDGNNIDYPLMKELSMLLGANPNQQIPTTTFLPLDSR